MTTSGGGMLASDDRDLIEKARFWSQQAREPCVHYEHLKKSGHNYRMSNILGGRWPGAACRYLDERVRKKREIFQTYSDGLKDLPGISFMPEPDWSLSNRWLTVILIDPDLAGVHPEAIRQALEAENIESRPVWKPMHLQPVFEIRAEGRRLKAEGGGLRSEDKLGRENDKKRYPCRVVGGAVSRELFERGLCLPSGTAMTEADIDRVISIALRALGVDA